MNFLVSTDFEKQIKADQLDTITGGDSTLLDEVETDAISEMTSYLRQRYNTALVFSQTGPDRFPVLVLYLVDMCLYHLHSRINPRKVPDLREKRYDMAIHWLQKVSAGKLSPDLPEPDDTSDDIRWGSNEMLSHGY